MWKCLQVLPAFVIGLVITALYYIPTAAESNSSQQEMKYITLVIGWIEKPPYVTSPSNGSFSDDIQGMIRDVLYRHLTVECGYYSKILYEVTTKKSEAEFGMIELLRQNKVDIALPIFENSGNRKYSEFPYFKLDDYPGTEYITIEADTSALGVVMSSVLKAWPLLAVTLVLTAIAGIIMWALVSILIAPINPGKPGLNQNY